VSDFNKQTIAQGDLIFKAGDPADTLFVVQAGEIELMDAASGAVFATVGAGQSLGEQALVPGGIRGATARAKTEVQLLQITATELQDLMEKQTPVLRPLLEALMLQQSMHNAMRRPA
jgi:CRP-like cAMP-binding protein